MAPRFVENRKASAIRTSIPTRPIRRCMRWSLPTLPLESQFSFGANHFSNKRQDVRWFRPDFKAFRQQSHRVRKTEVQIVTQVAQPLAGFTRIAKPLLDDQADAGIDRVFFFLAATAEHHAGDAHLLVLNCRDKSVRRCGYSRFVSRLRQAGGG